MAPLADAPIRTFSVGFAEPGANELPYARLAARWVGAVHREVTATAGEFWSALPQLVWSAMPDGSCDYFSAQWTEHTGIPEADLLGWRWLETLHSDDREPTRKFWLESVAEHHPYDIEYRVRRRDADHRAAHLQKGRALQP